MIDRVWPGPIPRVPHSGCTLSPAGSPGTPHGLSGYPGFSALHLDYSQYLTIPIPGYWTPFGPVINKPGLLAKWQNWSCKESHFSQNSQILRKVVITGILTFCQNDYFSGYFSLSQSLLSLSTLAPFRDLSLKPVNTRFITKMTKSPSLECGLTTDISG